MAITLTDLSTLRNLGFDAIIDVRSPAEFAEDHVPGAINMPVLSNAERARVGTIYKQDSPFAARKIGAALVARNAAAAIEAHMMGHDGAWRPLVYCWRGGQRSGSFASILQQIGWRAETLAGGYQSWRRHVVALLYDGALPFRVIRLDGLTGTAKTATLRAAAGLGAQVLDLEGLARHRGSILGDIDGDQPAQKLFETRLLETLADLDPARPLLVEAESARIGTCRLPPALWASMKSAPRIVLDTTPETRARFLAAEYTVLTSDPTALDTRLTGLARHVGHATIARWRDHLIGGDDTALAHALITDHYDPAYRRLRRVDATPILATLDAGDLTPDAIARTARSLLAHLS